MGDIINVSYGKCTFCCGHFYPGYLKHMLGKSRLQSGHKSAIEMKVDQRKYNNARAASRDDGDDNGDDDGDDDDDEEGVEDLEVMIMM